jgi:serpin B
MKKIKRVAMLLCFIMIISTLSACSQIMRASASKPINSKKLLGASTDVTKVENIDQAYVTGLNTFAYGIFSKLSGEENVFISPYSISLALSMLYNGADKDTRTEMAKLLGFDQLKDYTVDYNELANHYMNANSKYLRKTLQKADPKVELEIANSIWLAENAIFQDTIESALLAPVRNYYNSDIIQVDFADDKTLDQVNQWVSDNTDAMIDPFLEKFLDKETLRLFLVNAIYFNGKWSNPFSPEDTHSQSFQGLTNASSVDMMYMFDQEYRYYNANGLRGIEIPYGNETLVMNLLIPEDAANTTINQVYTKLSAIEVDQYLQQLDEVAKTEIGTLAVPKFEMEYGTVSLNEALKELGMKQAFEEGNANYGLIGDDLFVSMVGHKAKIRVEEWGTKAAAATSVEINTTAAQVEEPLRFIVDVPFIFFIRDKQSDTILFIGEMNNMD